MIYVGKNGKAASVSAVKVGDGNGKAQNVVGGWVGDENGKARRIWSLDRPFWKFTCSHSITLIVSGKNIEIDFGDGTVMDLGTPFDETISHDFQDAETHQVTIYGVMSDIVVGTGISSIDTPFPKNKIVSFSNTFHNCTSLTSIPAGLFDNCPNVTSFSGAFEGCTSLASIPAGLFDNCTAVTSFSFAFSGCNSLAAIPAGLFDNCTAVTNFSQTFNSCTSLAAIPAGLFDNFTVVTSFAAAFQYCNSLAAIPAGLFDNCTAVTDFRFTFQNCTAITSAAPELWDTVKWPNVTAYERCFRSCTNAANYADIPADWK